MSNRQANMAGVTFEPVAKRSQPTPSEWVIITGVAYPAVVIALEFVSRMCANAFFDLLPTHGHVVAALLVPAGNLLVWKHLWDGRPRGMKWLAFANGLVIAIAGFYALLFLPFVPLAVIAIPVGIGLLPLAPLVAFASALKLCAAFWTRHEGQRIGRALAAGLAVGLVCLLVLDIPSAATRLGIQWAGSDVAAERERGLALLRTLGDDDLLLRLCYGITGQPNGPLSAFVMYGGSDVLRPRQAPAVPSQFQAREIYYRVHGVPFNTKPAPVRSGQPRFAEWQFDEDHGGTQVGGRLNGLSMASSRIDGSISGDDAVAYLEWTVEFRNTAPIDREARLQLALPPGAVVSRATLWVNGEEREAAYGGRGEVRAAYQRLAVQQRRDPLLVTTKGADRVLAQAFPVPRNSGTIKFKIGISAPLEMVDRSQARLTLPAIVDRNFSYPSEMRHSVWIESKQPLAASALGLSSSRGAAQQFRLSGSMDDRTLSHPRPTIAVARSAEAAKLAARIGDGEPVVQEITLGAAQPAALVLVVDGSARLAGTTAQLIGALDAIPAETKVGAIIASEPMQHVALAPWSPAHKQAIVELLRSTSFVGGQDNASALAEALQMLEAEPNAALLWIHGPQPVSFSAGAARLEQTVARLKQLPAVILYTVEPGPNELLPDAPWVWSARSLPQTDTVEADLARFFRAAASEARQYVIRRTQADSAEGLAKGSEHIARLWARDRVLDLMRGNANENRATAVALASRYRLVTPVSGAVVLETQQQYDENRLTPVSQATVPTVPEPHEWALIVVACAALSWLAWRNRQRFVYA